MSQDTGDETNSRDVIQTLLQRSDLLGRLADGPATKRDLRDDLEVSRSTIYKAVRELEGSGLVEQDEGSVRLTLSGQLLASRFREFEASVSAVQRQQSLLAALPADAPLSPALLDGADSVLAESVAPDRPLNYLEDVIREADRVVGFAPVALQRYVELFYQQLADGGLTADVVFGRAVLDHMRDEYGDRLRKGLEADRFTLRATDANLPFGLVVTEETQQVAVAVYGEDGDAKGVIANDTPAALDWGRDVFERYREEAAKIEE